MGAGEIRVLFSINRSQASNLPSGTPGGLKQAFDKQLRNEPRATGRLALHVVWLIELGARAIPASKTAEI